MDFYCLAGGGIRAGYPSRRLLRSVARRTRRQVAGRVVLALTSDHYYALHGVRPGTRLGRARHSLRVRFHFTIGRNTWYFVRDRAAAGLLKVRRGVIEEVGIADRRLCTRRGAARRFIASFD